MNRRGFVAFVTVALAEMGLVRTATAVNKECVHDHHCIDGRICAEGKCLPRGDEPGEHGPPLPCGGGCPADCFCGDDGYCHRVVIVDGQPTVITVIQTVVVGGGGGGGGGRKKRGGKRRRKGGRRRR